MQKPVETGVSYIGRAVRIAVLWMAWIYAGVVTFDLPRLLSEKADLIARLADASQEAKIYVGIWILGSVVLCAFLITSLRHAFSSSKASEANR